MALFLLFLLAFIWGSSFILIKVGLDLYDATTIGSLRVLYASIVMLPFSFIAFRKRYALIDYGYMAVFGLLGSLIPAYLFSIAILGINSSLAGILNTTTPLFTVLIGIGFFGLTLTKRHIQGLSLGFGGSIVLMLPALLFDDAVNQLGHSLLVLVATLMYGISTNVIKSKLAHVKAIDVTALGMLLATPLCLVQLTLENQWSLIFAFDHQSFWAIFILGAIGTALALVIFNQLVRLGDAVTAASVTYLIPVVALIWGAIFKEMITFFDIIGVSMTLLGISLMNRKTKS